MVFSSAVTCPCLPSAFTRTASTASRLSAAATSASSSDPRVSMSVTPAPLFVLNEKGAASLSANRAPHNRRPMPFEVSSRREGLVGLGDDCLERFRLVHSDIGQHLAVQFDAGQLQAMHELAVGQTFHADGGVDALDPERAEVPLLNLAVAISVLPRLLHRLFGDADRVLAAAVIALGGLARPLVTGVRGYTTFDACHLSVLLTGQIGRAHV